MQPDANSLEDDDERETAGRVSQLSHEVTALKRNQESLLKLVAGMAVGGYRFDPKAVRSKTANEITDDLLRLGISLDQDTVLKWLRLAAELLPDKS